MADIYSKTVFTVIAVALSVIVWNQTFNPAQVQLGNGCGISFAQPCYVKFFSTPEVFITNLP